MNEKREIERKREDFEELKNDKAKKIDNFID